MFMQGCLHLELFLFNTAILLCIVLVDELDCKDGCFGSERCCFLDTAFQSVSAMRLWTLLRTLLITMHMLLILSFSTRFEMAVVSAVEPVVNVGYHSYCCVWVFKCLTSEYECKCLEMPYEFHMSIAA